MKDFFHDLDEEEGGDLAALRRALIEGEESGVGEYSRDEIIAELDKESLV